MAWRSECARVRPLPLIAVALVFMVPFVELGGLRQHGATRQRGTRMLIGGAMAAVEIGQAGSERRVRYSQVADFAGFDGGALFDQPEPSRASAIPVSHGAHIPLTSNRQFVQYTEL